MHRSALALLLADRIREHCPKDGPCTLWLEGRWKGEGTFWLSRVDRVVSSNENTDFAQMQAE